MEAEALWQRIQTAADDKKAHEIVVFAIEQVSILADYVMIASGTSTTHVGSVAQGILDAVEQEGLTPRVEGLTEGKWVLIDLGSVIVHVMTDEIRKFYALEHLWARAQVVFPPERAVRPAP